MCSILDELATIRADHPLLKYHHSGWNGVGGMDMDTGTGTGGLVTDLAALVHDAAWQQSVWRVYIRLYWNFAMSFAAKTKECALRLGPVINSAVGKGFMVDTAIAHGANLPSFLKIMKRMRCPGAVREEKWLMDFMTTREHMMGNRGRDRSRAWKKLLGFGNLSLRLPIRVCDGHWGQNIVIDT